jgi:hypothetical protein
MILHNQQLNYVFNQEQDSPDHLFNFFEEIMAN